MNAIKAWLDAHLIDDWTKAYRLASVRFGLIGTAAAGAWIAIGDDAHGALLSWLHIDPKWTVPIGFVVAVVLRLKRGKDDQ